MKKKKLCLLLSMSFVSGINTFLPTTTRATEISTEIQQQQTQTRTIKGTVKDETGTPLMGATVLVKGTTNGIITDLDGAFTLKVAADARIVSISYIGYKPLELPIDGHTVFNVQLEPSAIGLDEVVAIGYGTLKKADVTSAVSSVKAENFVKGAVVDAGQLIQGKVAGLNISSATGDPTQGTKIMLRGTSSLKGGTDPLILVDGVPGSFSTVAPEDIESIDVLKDGSATAIYGTRGTNGVIIITTKRSNRDMPTSIEYSGYLSVSHMARKADFMSASDFRNRRQAYEFQGALGEDFGQDTDWLDEISRTGISHVHNLILRGGNKTTHMTAALNYRDMEGTMKKSDNKSMTARVEVSHSMFDTKLTSNLSIIARENSYQNGTDGGSFDTYVYRQALIHNPTEPLRDEQGNWFERDIFEYANPASWIEETSGVNRYRNIRVTGSMEFKPVEWLSFKGMYTRKGDSGTRGFYQTKKHYTTIVGKKNGYASRGTSDLISNLGEFTVNLKKSFGLHRITALAGYSYEDNTNEDYWMQNWDFPTDAYTYNNIGIGQALKRGEVPMSSTKNKDKLIAFFGRVSYSFADKYLLMVSLRHEGSSRFGTDHKWGNFPGVSVGWRISEEPFMKAYAWVNNLKLRGGYGITGINVAKAYTSLSSMNYDGAFIYNGEWIKELNPVRNPNADLRWEKKHEYNVGLDWDLFDGRIGGSVDYYTRITKDALWDYTVPVPPYLYSSIVANVGEIKNSGLEIQVNATPVQTKDFSWDTSVSYSTNQNKLVSLDNDQFKMSTDWFEDGDAGSPIKVATHIVKIGNSIGDFYGLKSVDITDDGHWIIETPAGERRVPYDDQSGLEKDRQIVGNGVPKHFLNWNNTLRWKGFDLSMNMRGAFDFQILNYQRMYYETANPNIQYNRLNSAFDKVYGKSVLKDDQRFVSYYIENGSYWKIDNVTLGYTFNMNRCKYINQLRIYGSCKNLATITGYSGIDPEVDITGLHPGCDDRDKYPTVRTYTFGVNVTF